MRTAYSRVAAEPFARLQSSSAPSWGTVVATPHRLKLFQRWEGDDYTLCPTKVFFAHYEVLQEARKRIQPFRAGRDFPPTWPRARDGLCFFSSSSLTSFRPLNTPSMSLDFSPVPQGTFRPLLPLCFR